LQIGNIYIQQTQILNWTEEKYGDKGNILQALHSDEQKDDKN